MNRNNRPNTTKPLLSGQILPSREAAPQFAQRTWVISSISVVWSRILLDSGLVNSTRTMPRLSVSDLVDTLHSLHLSKRVSLHPRRKNRLKKGPAHGYDDLIVFNQDRNILQDPLFIATCSFYFVLYTMKAHLFRFKKRSLYSAFFRSLSRSCPSCETPGAHPCPRYEPAQCDSAHQ